MISDQWSDNWLFPSRDNYTFHRCAILPQSLFHHPHHHHHHRHHQHHPHHHQHPIINITTTPTIIKPCPELSTAVQFLSVFTWLRIKLNHPIDFLMAPCIAMLHNLCPTISQNINQLNLSSGWSDTRHQHRNKRLHSGGAGSYQSLTVIINQTTKDHRRPLKRSFL